MLRPTSRWPAVVALIGAILGFYFATVSTTDYAAHLDRRLHDVTCSFIPGATGGDDAEACRAAMYSPYSALLKGDYWGGIPVSLFALGAFTFFLGFSLYLAVAGPKAPRKAVGFFAAVSITPSLVSLVMLVISITQLGELCKTCVGLYIASLLVSVGGLLGLGTIARSASAVPRPHANFFLPLVWLVGLGVVTLLPAVVYAASVPNHDKYLTECGKLEVPPAEHHELVRATGSEAKETAIMLEDPLCPTCRAFHQRLKGEGVLDRLDIKLVMFPLDDSCNWMLTGAMHPGACMLSRAVICGDERGLEVLEWAFDEQEYLARAGKKGEDTLRAVIKERWGEALTQCVDSEQASARLNKHLHYASENRVPVSTPQVYLGERRVCDEDTDIGLRYTLARLAPEVIE